MKRKLNVNTICFIVAGIIAVTVPCMRSVAADPAKINTSALKSTGNVVYSKDSDSIVQFSKEDLEYLINRVENELAPICE